MAATLSIVVPVYDNWWMTERLLRVLDDLRPSSLPFETIVVDNASRDETPSAIAQFPWVRYERMDRNRNFAGACNAGAHLAESDLVLFLNNDAYPIGDALTALARAFDRDDAAVAGGALFFEDGATQCAGFVVLPNAHWHYSCRNLPPALAGVTRPRDAIGVSGAAMAVRRQWFLAGGGFDESYVNGFEDVDLCMRARAAGRAIVYVAGARFAHYEGASAGRFDREAENERRFYDRWASAFADIPRTARGEVGGVFVRADPGASPLCLAGLADLESGMRSFGHPVVRGEPGFRHRFDRRFRVRAELAWFTRGRAPAGVTIQRRPGAPAVIRTHGAVDLDVPWLPCASAERVAALPVAAARAGAGGALAIAGFEFLPPGRKAEVTRALEDLAARDPAVRFIALSAPAASELGACLGDRVTQADLLGERANRIEIACVLQAGLTDASAFGNVLLAQAELATVVLAETEPAALLAPDVVSTAARGDVAAQISRLFADPGARARLAARSAADARRRFSPRRSAIRVIDLLCAARFGLERPASARSNTPLAR
ncbi:MAG TPA: glycosyltransferase family 2 protein [Candidatus Tumulicola sp.]